MGEKIIIRTSEKELRELYEIKLLSSKEISELFSTSQRTILRLLHMFGIEVREPSAAKKCADLDRKIEKIFS